MLLKYLLFAVTAASLLKYLPNGNLDNEQLFYVVIIGTVFVFVLENIVFRASDGMREGMSDALSPTCDLPTRTPWKYSLSNLDQDHAMSGIRFDSDSPVNPRIKLGEFSGSELTASQIHDALESQRYNTDKKPGYYLANNGEYSAEGLSFEDAAALVVKSKLRTLVDQHNFHIPWSPHTHVGKARGYLNWQQTY